MLTGTLQLEWRLASYQQQLTTPSPLQSIKSAAEWVMIDENLLTAIL